MSERTLTPQSPPTAPPDAAPSQPSGSSPPAAPPGPIAPQPPETISAGAPVLVDDGTLLARRPAGASTDSGKPLTLPTLGSPHGGEPQGLIALARQSDAWRQFCRCFPRWSRVTDRLSRAALTALSENRPVDPNDSYTWQSTEAHAKAVLRRHGYSKIEPRNLTAGAIQRMLEAQAEADRAAGLDWRILTDPASALDERLREAHRNVPIDLDDPDVWSWSTGKRAALARRHTIAGEQVDELSRWAVANAGDFDPASMRCWRIASPTWLELARSTLAPVGNVERPVGVFVTPDSRGGGWRLGPTLSLELIRLIDELGGTIEHGLTEATIPGQMIGEFLGRVNQRTLHAGPKELAESANQLGQELSKVLGVAVHPGLPIDRVERWGRLNLKRWGTGTLVIRAMTFRVKDFPAKRLGALPGTKRGDMAASAAMDLGEAIEAAAEREIPVLLSTEASGFLDGTVRVGRMKGRPGMLTLTESDGMSATTRRFVADQALTLLRRLKQQNANVVLDAGARQLVRMTIARPLDDDVILKAPQRRIAALKVVGSGLDMSQTATGKTITTGRAIYHRAATTTGFRGMVIVEGRKITQWYEELKLGAPERGLPPLAPNCEVMILDERTPIAAQIRRFHRELGPRAGVVLVSNGLMERFHRELAVIHWHFAVADEAHRYRNTATDAHRALAQLRFAAIADFWGLTATPKGKEAGNIDVLVGVCVGDRTLIEERLNSREAGDLMDEVNAARYRVNYGPHCVRLTKKEMASYLPRVLPAQPMPIEPDPALLELLQALREGGRAAFRRLLELLHELKTLDKHTELYRNALLEFASVQGMVLGNVDRFVDASVDPETLTHSSSLLAKTLVREGLVAAAMKGGGDGLPLLRGIVAQSLAEQAGEEQILVFAERVWCLRQLASTVRERYNVEAHVADGSTKTRDFAELRRRFTAGEFPVLCLSPAFHEGHNLQSASGQVHLDIPPVPDPIEQRTGRIQRIGSPHATVWTSIPYIVGGGTEHMVKIVAPRGGESHQILDAPEGVSAQESTIAMMLGAITSQVAENKEQEGYIGTAARLRVAARVFGAG